MTRRQHLNLTVRAVRQLRHNWALPPSRPLLWQRLASGPACSAYEWIQEIAVGRKIAECALASGPVVIIGYWRSGTTLLHEYLCRDPRFGYPTTYACFNPQHFVLTERAGNVAAGSRTRRPMDDMLIDASSPQEDEFALLCLGARSPYEAIFAPDRLAQALALADLDALSADERAAWGSTFLRFLHAVSARQSGRPLILKSPAHGNRIEALARLLPDPRFVLIVRDPRAVFASAVRMWRSMFSFYAFGPLPTEDDTCHAVLADRPRYEASLAQGLAALPENRRFLLRYEGLVADPVATIEALYRQLELGDFATVRDTISDEARRRASYQARSEQPDDLWRGAVTDRWQEIVRRYGYG